MEEIRARDCPRDASGWNDSENPWSRLIRLFIAVKKLRQKHPRNPSYTLSHPCPVTANVETLILLRGGRSIEKRLFVFWHFKQGSTVELLLTV